MPSKISCENCCMELRFSTPADSLPWQVQGGGNVGNALTAAARLGLECRIFTKASSTVCCSSSI